MEIVYYSNNPSSLPNFNFYNKASPPPLSIGDNENSLLASLNEDSFTGGFREEFTIKSLFGVSQNSPIAPLLSRSFIIRTRKMKIFLIKSDGHLEMIVFNGVNPSLCHADHVKHQIPLLETHAIHRRADLINSEEFLLRAYGTNQYIRLTQENNRNIINVEIYEKYEGRQQEPGFIFIRKMKPISLDLEGDYLNLEIYKNIESSYTNGKNVLNILYNTRS